MASTGRAKRRYSSVKAARSAPADALDQPGIALGGCHGDEYTPRLTEHNPERIAVRCAAAEQPAAVDDERVPVTKLARVR